MVKLIVSYTTNVQIKLISALTYEKLGMGLFQNW